MVVEPRPGGGKLGPGNIGRSSKLVYLGPGNTVVGLQALRASELTLSIGQGGLGHLQIGPGLAIIQP